MKSRKYILIVLAFLTSLLCMVGASLWVVLTDTIVKPDKFKQIAPTCTEPTINPIFYGEQAELTHSPQEGDTDGTWSISDTTTFTASSTTTTSDTAGNKIVQTTAKATLTFTPSSIKYSTVTKEFTVPMYAVASYGSTYYSTVDGALSAANSANTGTVYVTPFGYSLETGTGKAVKAKTIQTTTIINTDVTLALPYDIETPDTTLEYILRTSTNASKSAYGNSTYLKNQIQIAEGHTVTNNGTINIAGQVSGGSASDKLNSMTAGNHSQINMSANSTLNNTGTINCYGFINDISSDRTAHINSTDGTMTVMFSVVEHRGGSFYFGMLDPANEPAHGALLDAAIEGLNTPSNFTAETLKCPPFNRFYIESINCKLTVKQTSTLIGHANLYANDGHNPTDISLISSSDSLITLTNASSYVVSQFDAKTKVNKLDIYGDMKLNQLSLGLTVKKSALNNTVTTTINVKLGTRTVFFPLSYHFDITLKPFNDGTQAKVDLTSQKLKLLPGSNVTIEKGVTVTAGSLAVYESNELLNSVDPTARYYTNTTPAKLTVNGTLNADFLGGEIVTEGSTGTLIIKQSNTVVSEEMSGQKTGLSTSFNVYITTMDMGYTGIFYYSDDACRLTSNGSIVSSINTTLYVGTYYATNGKWKPETITITYNSSGGSTIEPSTGISVPSNGYSIPTNINTTKIPTRTNYTFKGWYLDLNYTQEAAGAIIYDYTTLYAKWEKDASKILVDFETIGTNQQDLIATNEFATQEISGTTTKASIPTNADTNYNNIATYTRYVEGYYADANGTIAFDFTQIITENTTIYVKWADKYTFTINTTQGKQGDNGGDPGKYPAFKFELLNTSNTSYYSETFTTTKDDSFTRYIVPNHSVKITDTGSTISSGTGTTKITTKDQKISIVGAKGAAACIAAGTLITLADGTQKKVEDLLETDVLLVFDHETGKYVEANILFIERDGWDYYNVINLEFSNGTKTRLIYEHGLFDLTLNKYVYITERNYSEFLGHEFAVLGENGAYEKITLDKAYMTYEYTGCYSLVTVYHMNYFIDGLFSMPGGIDGLFNIFEYGENLTYDQEKMQADIEKYGLFTYEDFKDYIPEEIYNAFPAPYFKVAIGKGMLTFDTLLQYIEQFIVKNGLM